MTKKELADLLELFPEECKIYLVTDYGNRPTESKSIYIMEGENNFTPAKATAICINVH